MAERVGGEKGTPSFFRSRVNDALGWFMESSAPRILQGIMAIFGLWISGVTQPCLHSGMVAGVFASSRLPGSRGGSFGLPQDGLFFTKAR